MAQKPKNGLYLQYMISQSSIQEILNTAQIEDVVQDYVNLRRRGVNMLGLCPFHDEKSPSFTVSPAKNIYKCFGCGKGGNPINFIMDHESLSYPEALRFLAEKYGIELEEDVKSDKYREEQQRAESLYLINKFAAEHFNHNLLETDEGKSVGLSYFKARGFRGATIESFNLGYSMDSYDHFAKLAVDKKYNLDSLKSLGLVSEKGYDFYRGRVIFPIHSLSGKVIGFGARQLTENKKSPKYVNSPESEIYNKRNTLYGIYQAKGDIRKKDFCILVEGYTDVISLHQSEIRNAVASSGTSLTEAQIRLVKRYTNNITILYDGDSAGIKAALRGMDLILEQDMNVRLVLLPEKEDPDSYVKSVGTAAFNEYIEANSKDFILFKTSLVLEESGNDPIKKAVLLKDIVLSLSKISDTIKRSLYIRQCSSLLGIEERLLVQETNKAIKGNIRNKQVEKDRQVMRDQRTARLERASQSDPSKTGDQAPDGEYIEYQTDEEDGSYDPDDVNKSAAQQFSRFEVVGDEHQEKDLARICVTLGDSMYNEEEEIKVASYIFINIEDMLDHFDNQVYKQIITEAHTAVTDQSLDFGTYFMNHRDDAIRDMAINLMSSPYTYANWESKEVELQTQKQPELNFVRDSYQAILRFKLRKVKKIMDQLSNQIKTMNSENEDFIINLKVLKKLQEERNHMAAELHTVIL